MDAALQDDINPHMPQKQPRSHGTHHNDSSGTTEQLVFVHTTTTAAVQQQNNWSFVTATVLLCSCECDDDAIVTTVARPIFTAATHLFEPHPVITYIGMSDDDDAPPV